MFHGIVPRWEHPAALTAPPCRPGRRRSRGRSCRGGSGWDLRPCSKREGRGPTGTGRRWQRGWTQLTLGRSAAEDAAKVESLDRAVAESARDETLERCFGPSLAGDAIQAKCVTTREQVGDSLNADDVHAGQGGLGGAQGMSLVAVAAGGRLPSFRMPT